MGFNPFSGRSLVGLGTLGLSELAGEDTMSKIPVLNSLGGYRSDATKQLLATQQRLAQETAEQRKQNERMRMNALGQQMLAFNPQNQAVAQMFGPEAAFNPQQMAAMANDPGARSQQDFQAAQQAAMPTFNSPIDPKTRTRQGSVMQGWTPEDLQRMQENERRKQMLQQNLQPLPQAPPPLQMTAPQAGRRY
jgi:hypothetical protein